MAAKTDFFLLQRLIEVGGVLSPWESYGMKKLLFGLQLYLSYYPWAVVQWKVKQSSYHVTM